MTAKDYADWWEFSAPQVCPPQETEKEYITVRKSRLSEAGHIVLVMVDFLETYKITDDPDTWIRGIVRPAKTEIAQAVEALRSIGAPELAELIAKSKARPGASMEELSDLLRDTSKFSALFPNVAVERKAKRIDAPTAKELRAVLKKYIDEHAADLVSDIDKYGDPRKAPDFNRRRARRAIEERNILLCIWAAQDKAIPRMNERIKILEEALSKSEGGKKKSTDIRWLKKEYKSLQKHSDPLRLLPCHPMSPFWISSLRDSTVRGNDSTSPVS